MEEKNIVTIEEETMETTENNNKSGKGGLGILIGVGLGVAGTALFKKIKKAISKRKAAAYEEDLDEDEFYDDEDEVDDSEE